MHMVEFWGWESTLSTQSPDRTQKFGIFRGVLEIPKNKKPRKHWADGVLRLKQ